MKEKFDFIKALISGSPIYLNTTMPVADVSKITISRTPDSFDGWRDIIISRKSGEVQMGRVSPVGKIRDSRNVFLGVFTTENTQIRYAVYNNTKKWVEISKQKYEKLKAEFPEVSVLMLPALGPDGTTHCLNASNIIQIS